MSAVDYRTLKFKASHIANWINEHVPHAKNTYDICNYVKEHKVYVAEDLYKKGADYKDNNEYVAVTYPWSYDILKLVNYCRDDFVWIDIVNINQNSHDIEAELSILPKIYKEFDRHYVFSYESFNRGWCLFEICTANEDEFFFKSEPMTFEGEWNLVYNNNKIIDNGHEVDFVVENIDFNKCKFSYETDREYVKKAIIQKYGNVEAFNDKLLMIMEFYVGLFTRNLGGNGPEFEDE